LSSATIDAIYPTPQFSERSEEIHALETTEQKIVFIIAVITAIIPIAFSILLFIWAEQPQLVTASPLFCQLIVWGGELCIIAIILSSIWVNDVLCNLTIWLFVLGLDLLLGCLLIKNYRIYLFFKKVASYVIKPVPDSNLMIGIGIIIVIDAVIIAIWEIFFQITSVYNNVDNFRPIYNYNYCYSSAEDVFISILIIYKGLLLLAAVFVSVLLRNLDSDFNEVKYLALAIYNLAFCFMVEIIFWRGIPDYWLKFVLKYILAIWAVVITLIVIFAPKFYFVCIGKDHTKGGIELSNMVSNNEKSTLKNKIKELEREIEKLKTH